MTEVQVYNGNQIGGCYTVISTDTTRIMIDYGDCLPGASGKQESYDWEHDEKIDAVFFTHYHGDHVGKFMEIPKNIPLYMGSVARRVMINIHEALSRVKELSKEQLAMLEVLQDDERVHEVIIAKTIHKGDITITPYLVDHSAYDAYMYLIETPDKTILHTGDFRGHGYRGSKMLDVIEKHVHKDGRSVDILVTEGTMMSRLKEKVLTEPQMQAKAKKLFKKHKHVFLVCSSTNLDSLATFYQAALDKDRYTYCYNYYLYNQLKTFSNTAGEKSELYHFEEIYTVDFDKKRSWKVGDKPMTQEEWMRENGFLCIIKPEARFEEWIERFKDEKPLIIYSMWEGYLDSKHKAYNKEWAEFFDKYKKSGQFYPLHTSGHASADMIAEVINAVDPQEEIIPMHTENAEGFKKLPIKEELKERIRTEKIRLTEEEIKKLYDMKDSRAVSKDLLDAFVSGAFCEFLEFARDNKELVICFRGNGNAINIYHHNHTVWELSVQKDGRYKKNPNYKVKINFDHARYTQEWFAQFSKLNKLKSEELGLGAAEGKAHEFSRKEEGTEEQKKALLKPEYKEQKLKSVGVGYIVCNKCGQDVSYSKEFVEKTYAIIMDLMKDYFNPSVNVDWFRKEFYGDKVKDADVMATVVKENKNPYIEKRWQQRLFQHFKCTDIGLYAYDLEFSQKFPDADIRSKMKKVVNEPDMLAVRYERGEPKSFVLVEVKSTATACSGTSGIEKHIRGMKAYSEKELFQGKLFKDKMLDEHLVEGNLFMDNRRKDIPKIFEQYKKIGVLPEDFKVPSFDTDDACNEEFKIERLLILTDDVLPKEERKQAQDENTNQTQNENTSAIDYYNEFPDRKKEINKLAKTCGCDIWIVEGHYYEKDIKLKQVDLEEG